MILTVESCKVAGRKRFAVVIVSINDRSQHFIAEFSIISWRIGKRDSGRPRILVKRWRSASKDGFWSLF